MSSNDHGQEGIGRAAALRMEYAIIGLGILALVLIFQPFSVTVFTVGSILVVLAGLVNNLLPLAQPEVKARSIVTIAMVVAMIFFIVVILSIIAAYLYGTFFLKAPDPNTVAGKVMLNATPFYLHPFTWIVAGLAILLAVLITLRNRKG